MQTPMNKNKITITEKEIEKEVIVIFKCRSCGKITKNKVNWGEDYYNKSEDLQGGYIHICSSVSAGVYSIYFECPFCHKQITIY